MHTLTLESDPIAVDVTFSADAFRVTLDDVCAFWRGFRASSMQPLNNVKIIG